LLSVKFGGVAFNIADMAGKSGLTRKSETSSYPWRGTRRKHKVTTQGQIMTQAIKGEPSRYVWSEAEGQLPFIQASVLAGVQEYMDQVNKNIVRIDK
jgi:hypothetical protein